MNNGATIVVDRTHMGRRASGLERITRELFSAEALAPLPVVGAECGSGRLAMAACQMISLPVRALGYANSVWVFSGYPPSPMFRLLRERSVMYVHDLFLLTRRGDLNRAAKAYMVPPFSTAIRRLRYFLTNSRTTADALAQHTASDAYILHYRPQVDNVFDLPPPSCSPKRNPRALIVGCIGTVEPRKNFLAAARIRRALQTKVDHPVELHIIGRPGWGGDFQALSQDPNVRLHGFLPDAAARKVIADFDLLLCTSHDEGLGLPLLEVQHAGLPVIAPDLPIFREVLGDSGLFIDPCRPEDASSAIAGLVRTPHWRARAAALDHANITAWNANARADRTRVIDFLGGLLARTKGESQGRVPCQP